MRGYAKKYTGLSYIQLLQTLQDGGFNKPLPKEDETPVEKYQKELKERSANNLENTAYVRGPGMTLGTLMYGAEHIVNYWKQKQEYKGKVKSAYAFMRLEKFVGSMGVDAMSSLINTTMSDMKKLYRGKDMRIEVAKILKRPNPMAHEILSAALITLEMAGHLYPDNELG